MSDGIKEMAPGGFHHRRPDAPSAHRRPGYPLSGCVPAEPDSVSPGSIRLALTEQHGKPPSDTGVMPQKILPCGIPKGSTNCHHALEESRCSEFRKHAGEDLQSKVLLIPIAEGPPLEYTDLVVESLDESQGHLVLHVAIGLDAVPVSFDHIGELLKWSQALPPEGTPPVVEEPTSPGGSVVVPELAERLLEEVGLVQSFVRPEQQLQGLPSLSIEILPAGEQMVLLSLDEAAILPREACVLLRTLSMAFPRWLRMWYLSYTIRASGA